MVGGIELFGFAFRIILDHDLERAQHRHAPRRGLVEMLPDRKIQHGGIDHAVGLGDPDPPHEVADSGGRHAAAA